MWEYVHYFFQSNHLDSVKSNPIQVKNDLKKYDTLCITMIITQCSEPILPLIYIISVKRNAQTCSTLINITVHE